MILFVTRKYPPSVGGMQKVSHRLATELAKLTQVRVIAWGRSQAFLPIFLWLATLRALPFLFTKDRPDALLVGDALLTPLGLFLGTLFRSPVVAIAHGLDITYPNPLYQRVMRFGLKRMDRVVCVSEATLAECQRRGVSPSRCVVIPWGIDATQELFSPVDRSRVKAALADGHGELLLTVGRLVERKGVADFIENVLPTLVAERPRLCYLVVGEGPERQRIQDLVGRLGLTEHVRLLGRVDDAVVEQLYCAADIFVMPNVPVAGDMEGLGIVALEASAHGLPVVAAGIEGIQAAVDAGKNGLLVEPFDHSAYVTMISRLLADEAARNDLGRRAKSFVAGRFRWETVAQLYLVALGCNEAHNVSS